MHLNNLILRLRHGLDPIQDWQTIRILHEILNNDNQSVLISHPINKFLSLEDFEPMELDEAVPHIKQLSDQGYEIAFSMTQFQGDDGGSLYLCYLINPEHKKSYYAAIDKNMDASKNPGFLFPMQYICQYPEQFTEIWAGAY